MVNQQSLVHIMVIRVVIRELVIIKKLAVLLVEHERLVVMSVNQIAITIAMNAVRHIKVLVEIWELSVMMDSMNLMTPNVVERTKTHVKIMMSHVVNHSLLHVAIKELNVTNTKLHPLPERNVLEKNVQIIIPNAVLVLKHVKVRMFNVLEVIMKQIGQVSIVGLKDVNLMQNLAVLRFQKHVLVKVLFVDMDYINIQFKTILNVRRVSIMRLGPMNVVIRLQTHAYLLKSNVMKDIMKVRELYVERIAKITKHHVVKIDQKRA
jgi:hypothetical protein